MSERSPLERASDNATELVSTVVTGVWLAALFTGQDWWLAALLVGYVVVVPLTSVLSGEEDESDTSSVSVGDSTTARTDDETPLERLRRRYAEGELTDEQFERKLERLLETETLEDVEEGTSEREREPDLN